MRGQHRFGRLHFLAFLRRRRSLLGFLRVLGLLLALFLGFILVLLLGFVLGLVLGLLLRFVLSLLLGLGLRVVLRFGLSLRLLVLFLHERVLRRGRKALQAFHIRIQLVGCRKRTLVENVFHLLVSVLTDEGELDVRDAVVALRLEDARATSRPTDVHAVGRSVQKRFRSHKNKKP